MGLTSHNTGVLNVNYRPIFILKGNERGKNGQVFETEAEALGSAGDKFRVWSTPLSYEAEPTSEPVTYRWTAAEGSQSLRVSEPAS